MAGTVQAAGADQVSPSAVHSDACGHPIENADFTYGSITTSYKYANSVYHWRDVTMVFDCRACGAKKVEHTETFYEEHDLIYDYGRLEFYCTTCNHYEYSDD